MPAHPGAHGIEGDVKMRAATLTIALAMVAASPMGGAAFAQGGVNMEMGARVCAAEQMLDETLAEFEARRKVEGQTPAWIWDAIDEMQNGPGKMTYTLKQVNGVRVLYANGGIDDKAHDNLKAALAAHKPIDEVWLNSPGGNSRVGVQMAHTLRGEGIITMVKAGNGCASACSTAFLGGLMRKVEPGAVYGVHMYSTQLAGSGPAVTQDIFNDIQWQGAMGATERIFFAQEMGVTRKWASIWSGTRPGCMTFMSQSELATTLVNNLLD
jgi:hypothetical protein